MPKSWDWDDKAFQVALKRYLDLKKNVDPPKELRRRAKNVGIKLIQLYEKKGVNLEDITLFAIGDNIRIRPKIRAKMHGKFRAIKRGKLKGQPGAMWTYEEIVKRELNARRSAKGFTSTGWFPAVKKLGGSPRRQVRAGTGPQRGKLDEKLTGLSISETLINQQPGAAHVMQKNKGLAQQALDLETADLVKHVAKKENEVARRVGL